ncbi:effector-associated domain EAD1-containing protein [Streptomyces sp. NPDC059866]|uniref:effector-associated domain EAD1-containing protein n=1 Tax=Streptomyces sp. NPDC059866 TaxID=3346978 RepID=UPI00364A8008
MNDAQRRRLIALLAELYPSVAAARELLDDIGYPTRLVPADSGMTSAISFWAEVVRNLEFGVLEDGVSLLVRQARWVWPGNRTLASIAEDLEEQAVWPTLMFLGGGSSDRMLELVREVADNSAFLLYESGMQTAVRVAGINEDALSRIRAGAREIDPECEVVFQEYAFRPALLRRLELFGPDRQLFELQEVPNTTLPRDIVPAVWAHYGENEGLAGRQRRAVVDYRNENGETSRLNPDLTLHEQQVRDGGVLEVSAESTAGIDAGLRMAAVRRVRDDILHFAATCEQFRVLSMDDDLLPLQFTAELRVPGLAPPDDQDAWPLVPKVVQRHEVLIVLPPEFPVQAPLVTWLTPVFHPNVVAVGPGEGQVCLGVLAEGYRPGMSVTVLCQMLIDMAGYRNYGVLPRNRSSATDPAQQVSDLLDAGDYVNRRAAAWAFSEEGRARIAALGGRALSIPGPASSRLTLAPRADGGEDGTRER